MESGKPVLRGPTGPQSGRTRGSGPRRAARKALVLCAAGLAALGLLETVVRHVTGPLCFFSDGHLPFDRDLGFRPTANVNSVSTDGEGDFPFRTNSLGFRGPELPPPGQPKPAGVERIVFVGDSMLHAWAVRDEQLMTERTRAAIEREGRNAEVYNLSCSDYGTGQELLLFRKYGRDLAPDAVVLELYTGNDVNNNGLELAGRWTPPAGDYLRPYLVPDGEGGLDTRHVHPVRSFLRRHLEAFALAELMLLRHGARHDVSWLQPWPPALEKRERIRSGRAPHEQYEIYREHPPGAPWESAWLATEAILRAFREECRVLGTRFLVLVIPQRDEVQLDGLGVSLDLTVQSEIQRSIDTLLDWNLPERRLAAFFEREGIEARFLLDPLREATTPDSLLYVMDGHLSGQAHGIAADEVAGWYLGREGGHAGVTTETRVATLPDPEHAPALLDFRKGDLRPFIVWDFHGWRTNRPGVGRGWMTGQIPQVLLPACTGDLVVRGWLPQEAPLPFALSLEVSKFRKQDFLLERSGPFELRLPSPIPAHLARRAFYLPVALRVARPYRPPGDVRQFGVFLQQIGFEGR